VKTSDCLRSREVYDEKPFFTLRHDITGLRLCVNAPALLRL
jgi:hypothetical protein